MEQPYLTKEHIQRAGKREGISHPVISVLEYHEPRILQIREEYSSISDNQEQQKHIRRNFGFLADAVEDLGHFPMGPLDIVAVWSKAHELMGNYQRYELVGIISAAYGIRASDTAEYPSPEWRGFPRQYIQERRLPERAVENRNGILHLKTRLSDIDVSLDKLDFYVYGTNESFSDLCHKAFRENDEEAMKRFEEMCAHEKEYSTPVLGEIHENFGNGLLPLKYEINKALKGDKC